MNLPSPEAVAESRRLLRALVTRRDFITATGLIAANIGGLSLTGCSSSSDGGGPTGSTNPPPTTTPAIPDGFFTVSGTISLPAGSKLKPTDLSVDVGTQVIPVSTSGTFTAGVPTSGPSLALLTDTSGNGVLMSMFTASTAPTISARTTAVSLVYYATAAYALPASSMSQVLALINNDPAITALESAVANAVAADPQAIINNAAPLGPAIKAALQTMLGSAIRRDASPNSPTNAPTQTTPYTPALSVPTLMSITPSAEQNGVMVNQDTNTTALLVSNTKRRGCKVYVYQVSSQVGTQITNLAPAVRETGPIDLASTENLSLFTALKDFLTFFRGSSPFQPVNLPAIPLILKPANADNTTYHAIVIASTWKVLAQNALEPAFFQLPIYAQEVATWRSDAQSLFNTTVFGDVLFPIFCFFGGIGVISASKSVVAGVVAQAAAAKSATFTRILTQLEAGSVGQVKAGIQAIVNDAFGSNLSTQFWKPLVLDVVGVAEAKALKAESQVLTQSRWLKGSKMFQAVFAPLFAVGAVLEAWDFGAVIYDTFNSDLGSSWTVTLIRQKLELTPENPRVAAGDRVNFTVALPANVTGNFVYEWSQTSLFATLSAVGEANVGTNITTTKRAVDLVTTGSDANPIAVVVVGYDISKSPREEIGRAGTTVTFLYPAEILPSNATLAINQQQVFSVLVTGQLPTDTVYNWSLIGQAGTLGGQTTRTTNTPQVTFNAANVPGSATLHVDVVNGTGVRFARADAPVAVEFPAVILPPNVIVGLNALQVYSVSVTGQLPAGILYKWTLSGQAGTLGGQTTQTTTVPQVAFTAGNVPGTGTLHVDVVTAAGVRWAKADGPVVVARAPSISITLAGPWDPTKQPPNGTYNYPAFGDARVQLEDEIGVDQIGFVYNVGSDNTIGVFVAIHLPTGSVVKTGDTFTRYANTVNSVGTFQFLMSNNQTDADAPGARQYAPTGTGTLRFDDVTRLANGAWVVNYSFNITSPAGATVVAVGTAKWV
ncbi:MAG: hypothetical protein ABJB66_08225 [Gemmatimonadaceae bacterium]